MFFKEPEVQKQHKNNIFTAIIIIIDSFIVSLY